MPVPSGPISLRTVCGCPWQSLVVGGWAVTCCARQSIRSGAPFKWLCCPPQAGPSQGMSHRQWDSAMRK